MKKALFELINVNEDVITTSGTVVDPCTTHYLAYVMNDPIDGTNYYVYNGTNFTKTSSTPTTLPSGKTYTPVAYYYYHSDANGNFIEWCPKFEGYTSSAYSADQTKKDSHIK